MEETPQHNARQWTVGQLRAELVGLADDTPVAVYVADKVGREFTTRQVLVGAGYGEGVDASQAPLDSEFVLSADYPASSHNR
jgi:hypothetical protein